ncbi:MAG: hypothetical protein ABIK28_05720 [Planctomycetota bacterium]
MFKKIGILILFGGLVFAPQALGQWASIPHNPAQPVYVEGFHVIHDDGNALNAFSAHARAWHPIGLKDSFVLGTGDWTALVRDTGGNYVRYSARLDNAAKAPIAPGSNLIMPPMVEDDVILILVFNSISGQPEAHAYSAHFNAWVLRPLVNTPAPADYATSRFVLCVRDGNTLYGFSARANAWVAYAANGSGALWADGNVVAVNVIDAALNPITVAFSGVVGIWSPSPIRHGTSALKVDHNVAYMRANAGGAQFAPCAYSAYNAAWIASPTPFNSGAVINEDLRDNVVYAEDAATSYMEAFGTRPGMNWAPVAAGAVFVDIFEDSILAEDGTFLHAFSGLSAGVWFSETYPGAGAHFPGTDHLMVYQDINNGIHAFSPALGAWAPVITAAVIPQPDDAVAFIETPTQLYGYAARWNKWVAMGVPGSVTMSTTGGSIAALQHISTGGDLRIWDERRNAFNGPFNAGGVSNMIPGRNLMLFESGTAMCAYSVQRNAFEAAPGAILPSFAPPVAEENVGMFIDSGGRVFAYASPAREHIWFAYPNGTEFQTASLSILPGSGFVGYSIKANPGDQVAMILSAFRLFTGTPAGWMSLLWLDLTGWWYMDGPYLVGAMPPNFHNQLYLPVGGAFNVQFWTQGLIHNGAYLSLTSAPDPFWLF